LLILFFFRFSKPPRPPFFPQELKGKPTIFIYSFLFSAVPKKTKPQNPKTPKKERSKNPKKPKNPKKEKEK
jgi:hypothetical protein